jgi:hypothetical protein
MYIDKRERFFAIVWVFRRAFHAAKKTGLRFFIMDNLEPSYLFEKSHAIVISFF